jgi:transposase
MMKKNPEREASLLDEWKKGTPAREAARITGVPEGTVYYYWKRFNRDPEKANRLAASLKPSRKLSDLDILLQSVKVQSAYEVQARFDSLLKEGKFEQAEHYIRAQREAERYQNEHKQDVSSIIAFYLADPERNAHLVLDVAREMIQRGVDGGMAFPDAVSSLEQMVVAAALKFNNPGWGAKLVAALEMLKNEHLSQQKARKIEKRVSLDEAARVVVEEGRKEFEMMQREAKAKGQILTFTPLTFLTSSTPQRPDSAHPAERLDSNAGKKPNKLPGDRPTKKPGPSDTTG